MAFLKLKTFVCTIFGVLFTCNVAAQASIGDWEFRAENDASAANGKVAFTFAQPNSGNEPKAKLIIRRIKPNSPVELLITDTHDKEKDKCEYKDWKITIDSTNVPVLGYTFEEAKTELKTNWSAPEDELWGMFKLGLKLAVQVEQKCDSFSGESKPASYEFSLRGSYAAYKFVLAGVE